MPEATPVAPVVEAPKVEAPKTEPVKTEAPPVAAPPPAAPAKDDAAERIAKAFGAMSKKEKQLVEESRKLSAERAELAKDREAVAAHKAALAAAKAKPLEALAALGLSYDELTNVIANNNQLTPELRTKAEIEEAKDLARKAAADLEEMKKENATAAERAKEARKQAAQQQFQAQYDRWVAGTVAFVKANAVQYELTNLNDAQGEVPKLIEAVHKKTGNLLTKEEAAERIEAYFVERVEKSVASEKWKRLQAEKAAKATPPAAKKGEEKPVEAKRPTLNNDLTATTKVPVPKKNETREETMARVKAAFEAAKAKNTPA